MLKRKSSAAWIRWSLTAACALGACAALFQGPAIADFTVGSGSTMTVGSNSTLVTTGSIVLDGVIEADGEIALSGNWNKATLGIFVQGNSTVTFFDTSLSSITGNTTFYVLRSTWTGKPILFQNNSIQTITNAFNIIGQDEDSEARLYSTVEGQKWGIRFPNGALTLHHARIRDSDAFENTVTATASYNDGNNNANWIFPDIPTNLRFTQVSSNALTATWDLYSGKSYRMSLSTAADFSVSLSSLVGPLNQNTTSYAALVPNATYYFKTASSADPKLLYSASITTATWAAIPIVEAFVANDVWESSISFHWASAGNSAGTYYEAQISTSSDFVLRSSSANSGGLAITSATLAANTLYYFRARARNHRMLWSDWSLAASTNTRDSIPPSAVTDLTALTGPVPGSIRLNWTSPGNDGPTGTAASYLIKMATASELAPALSNGHFNAAQNVNSTSPVPSPLAGGTSIQFMQVTGLVEGGTYYFAIKALDSAGLSGALSPGATAVAAEAVLAVVVDSDTYDFGTFVAVQSTISARAIIVTNSGNVTQRYALRATTATAGTPWALTSNRGIDQIAVNALFHNARPGDAEFEAVASSLTDLNQTSGAGGGTFAGNQTGSAVPMSTDRNLWFRLGMPLSTSTTEEQRIQIYVTAEQEP